MKTTSGMAWSFQALVRAALVVGLWSCGQDTAPPKPDGGGVDTTAPILVDSMQSATQVQVQSPVTFHVSARDDESPQLSFSWTATLGLLGSPAQTSTSSEITWTSPSCVPAGTAVEIKVTITNSSSASLCRNRMRTHRLDF